MRSIPLVLLCMCWNGILLAQFTYFSQLTGVQGDNETEQVSNIEVVDGGYMVWGGGTNDEVGFFYFVRKYDFQGQVLDQTTLVYYPQDYLYSGIINSLQYNSYTNEFIMLQGAETPNGVQGRFLGFNVNLELVTDLYFDLYTPNTYFLGFLIEEDGYTVIGEQGPNINSEGTFIAKLDFEGNVLWNKILQPEVYQHFYRNWNIIKESDGYLIVGRGNTGSTFGLITKTTALGIVENTISSVDISMPRTYGMIGCKLANEEIMTAQGFGYEWFPEFGNPNVYWTKQRVSKLSSEDYVPTDGLEYFTNYKYFRNGANKMLPTSDGGALILGGYYGYFFDFNSWMLKVDSNGNEEWFDEYTYQTCNDCENLLYDIELAPDGGCIAAGYFINWAEDPRSSTWLLKVDACGDLEWQGCSPLNVPERKAQRFAVYPNPSAGRFTFETSTQTRASSYVVYDLSGRVVAQENVNAAGNAYQIELNAPSGFYTLQVTTDDGKMEAYKIQVVR